MRRKHINWISKESWQLISHRAKLRRTGRLCQIGGHRVHCRIGTSLSRDWSDRMATIGSMVEAELAGGNVQEAFRHLKGWYRAASETQVKPCYYTLERHTLERVDLYAWRESPGNPLPINVAQVEINNDVPSDGKLRQVVGKLTNGRAAGASGMCAKHVREWLHGVRREEDPEGHGIDGAGDSWCLFVQLAQAAWAHGTIPRQLLWIIVVSIPKGGGGYHWIGLLEPVWKCIERFLTIIWKPSSCTTDSTAAAANLGQGPPSLRQNWPNSSLILSSDSFMVSSWIFRKPSMLWIGSGALCSWKDTVRDLG
jgi:hypothetical protein